MDRLNAPIQNLSLTPPETPLAMPAQDLGARFSDLSAPKTEKGPFWARIFVFGFASLLTAGLGFVFEDWFMMGGISAIEGSMIGLVMVTFFWIALSVVTAILGLPPARKRESGPVSTIKTALLLPVYGEPIEEVFARLSAMMDDLGKVETSQEFAVFILSDTREAGKAQREVNATLRLRRRLPDIAIYYRNRAQNTDYKSGNIADWVKRWGANYDAMLVLDSDSVMSGAALVALADAMAADAGAGLIQSIPRLEGSRTLFARLQQFANTVYGPTLARGLARWSGNSANFWGHNAIIRTRAFAACAGLPVLKGRHPFGGTVLSHDFVEAALLRRAGWKVSFVPEIIDSYESTPPTLVAHLLRDRRWCQGNIQHLGLLTTPGFSTVSRMHLFQGAMAYIVSIGWFLLLILWVLLGAAGAEGISYFSVENPNMPLWPQMDVVAKTLILALVYGMLVAPKLIGALRFWWLDPSLGSAGGIVQFWTSWVFEVVMSFLLAPNLMIQHILAVLRSLVGFDAGWKQVKQFPKIPETIRFHVPEVIVGVLMSALSVIGLLNWWLLPIAVCLLCAPILSLATATAPNWSNSVLKTPQETNPPDILKENRHLERQSAPVEVKPVRSATLSA